MTATIWKYPLDLYDDYGMVTDWPVMAMPEGAEILTLQLNNGTPTMWAKVDPDRPAVDRHFFIVGTGQSVPSEAGRYVGTWQTPIAAPTLVFHVTAHHHNTCGLKIRDPAAYPDDAAAAHAQFASWETGARAHAQHLLAYCGYVGLGTEELVDPRWVWVVGKHMITTVEELGGRWAPAADYGRRVAVLAQRLTA